MKHISGQQTTAMVDELLKEAGILSNIGGYVRRGAEYLGKRPHVRSGLEAVQSGIQGRYGRQMLGGAALGGIGGAAVDEENRLRGALIGAGLGTGLTAGRALATKGGRAAAKRGLKKQLYTVTGYTGRGRKPTIEEARELGIVPKIPKVTEFRGKTHAARYKKFRKARERVVREERAFREGMLSAPGVVSNLATRPIHTLKSGWKRGGVLGKGFAGLGAYETGRGLIEKPEPGGPGRAEKALRGLGSTVGWLVAPPTLLAGQLVGGGAGMIAGKAGKGIDVLRRSQSPTQAVRTTVGSIPVSSRGRVTQGPRAAGEFV